jgi:hypothetical protein
LLGRELFRAPSYSHFAICRQICSHNVQETDLSQFLPPTDEIYVKIDHVRFQHNSQLPERAVKLRTAFGRYAIRMLARLTAILTQVICDCIQRLRNACWQTPSYMSPGPVSPKSLPTNRPWTICVHATVRCTPNTRIDRRQTADLNVSPCKSSF